MINLRSQGVRTFVLQFSSHRPDETLERGWITVGGGPLQGEGSEDRLMSASPATEVPIEVI
jgi:hypothetical protein